MIDRQRDGRTADRQTKDCVRAKKDQNVCCNIFYKTRVILLEVLINTFRLTDVIVAV